MKPPKQPPNTQDKSVDPLYDKSMTPKSDELNSKGMPHTYQSVHVKLRETYGNAPICIWDEEHTSTLQWANVSGVYTSNIEDYLPMCRSCHASFDVTEVTRAKLSRRYKGRKSNNCVPVAQIKDGEVIAVFESGEEAWRRTGIWKTNITEATKGARYKTAGGYQWQRLPRHSV